MARKSGSSFSVSGRSADDRAVAEAKALASQHRRKRAKAERESADFEHQGRRVGAAIRRSVREAERQHLGYVTVRPARKSGSRKSRTICPRFETMLSLNPPRGSHVGGDGLSSFHYKWTSRGLAPRAGQKNSHRYRPGEAVNHVRYILRDDAREVEGGGIVSNISVDPDDVASLFGAIEELERIGGQANANIYCSIVIALPKELDAAGRARVLGQIGEELEAEELPYCFVAHKPDPRGSADNWHAHGILSLRPFRKREDGSYDLAAAPSSDLNDADFIYHLREAAARAMNVEMERAKKKRRFTHLSYADRGLDTKGQAKKGPGQKAIERRNEDLAAMRTERGMLARTIEVVQDFGRHLADLAARPHRDRAAILMALRTQAAAITKQATTIVVDEPAPVQSSPAGEIIRDTAPSISKVATPIGTSQLQRPVAQPGAARVPKPATTPMDGRPKPQPAPASPPAAAPSVPDDGFAEMMPRLRDKGQGR